MSMIDQITKMAGNGNAAKIADKVGPLIQQAGGIDGIVKKFESAGLGGIAKSWVDKGENKPVSSAQVKEALGPGELERVANDAGVSTDEAADGLAQVLPAAVDQVTPQGQVPSAAEVRTQLGG
jgi:uncharacterized protein YidB (DUF937 family)